MRKSGLFLLPALFLAALLILPACSDDDPVATNNNTGDPPTFDMSAVDEYEVPAALDDIEDSHAQQLAEYLSRMEWIDVKVNQLTPPPEMDGLVTKDGTWVRTWTTGVTGYDEMTYTLTIIQLPDRETWDLRGTGLRYEVQYVNYQFLSAQIARNRAWGWFEEYGSDGSGDLQYRYGWEIADNILTLTLDVHDSSDPYRTVVVLNQDTSGNLNHYLGEPGSGWLFRRFTWTPLTSFPFIFGTWTEYDEGGAVVATGHW